MNTKHLIIWAILPSCLVWLVSFILPVEYSTGACPYIIIFFTVINVLFNKYYSKFTEGKDPRTIAGVLMAFVGVKFILSIFAVAIFLYLNKAEQQIGFALHFFAIYMIFAIYETRTLLAQTKQQ